MASKRIDIIKASATLIGSVAAVSRSVLAYRKFRQDQESQEYKRGLQRKAWKQVMDGELSSAKIGDVEIKAPTSKTKKKKSKNKASASASSDKKKRSTTSLDLTAEATPEPPEGADKPNGQDGDAETPRS